MSIIGSNILAGAAGSDVAYEIEQSVRFNRSDSPYIERDIVSTGSRRKATYSWWFKRGNLGNTADVMFSSKEAGAGDNATVFSFNTDAGVRDKLTLAFGGTDDASYVMQISDRLFRDPSAWYHAVVSVNTDLSSQRVKLWINGELEGTNDSIPQNKDLRLSESDKFHVIGEDPRDNKHFEGYMAEWISLDGTAVTDADDFGEFDNNNVWRPIEPSGLTFGTNGFYLKFDETATNGLSEDYSGNDNHFSAPVNITTSGTGTDVFSDTPTTNWCTINPLNNGTGDTENGNLEHSRGSGDANSITYGTIGVTSGKWYWEAEMYSTSGGQYSIGIGMANEGASTGSSGTDVKIYSSYQGEKVGGGSYQSYGASYGVGDIIGVALDLETQDIEFYKNGVSQGVAFTSIPTTEPWFPVSWKNDSNVAHSFRWNFGQRDFAYTPPTGFKALNTSNLPAPTIKDGSQYFNTVLYTGTGATQSITGVGFQPDWTWLKGRSTAYNHYLYDVLRGTGKALQSNQTTTEETRTGLTAFDSDGFTLGSQAGDNGNGTTFVAWNWLAGGSGSSNTAGTITSTVSANPSAGFSIVTYTGNATAGATIGHGLGVKPKWMIVRQRDNTSHWAVYTETEGAGRHLLLNSTNAAANSGSNNYFTAEPTSTVFTVGSNSNVNANGGDMLAYCFASVEGYSKLGSYTGTNTSDNAFVYCGFAPAWLLVKASGTGGTHYDWRIYDNKRNTYNPVDNHLEANQSLAEDGDARINPIDFLSNGFKIRASYAEVGSSTTYLFVAFASNPFGGSGVSPATAR